ncbi:glycosyltransferase family 4 protein [Candidatus Peregrinibacteria bacterium]|nr:glycosyltransferase family 4 protein [Candidatus Peregrinibacteria bacterium]
MKIGIDASRYKHAEATGVEWYSWQIINGLLKVISVDDELILYSKERLGLEKIQNKILPGLRLWTLKSLSKEMRLNPPDVLFVPSHTLPLNLPKKSVITIHDVAFKHLPGVYSFSQFHYLNWSTKFAVKKATKIIVPSEATKQDLIKYYNCPKDKIVVIPHGFSEPKSVNDEKIMNESVIFKYFDIRKNDPYILFVGRLESKKNLPKLVEAFAKFQEKNPDYRLILAGKRGVGFEKIVKIVNKSSLAHKVIMPGYITEEEKAVLYKNCKFFVFPSLYEGFGLPILEAFYYGKAVLCSNTSSLPEVGGEAVHYVDPNDVEEMAAGLDKLASDEKYAENLVARGRERLKLFDWEKVAKKTLWTIKE